MKKILLASCVAAISVGVNAELTPLSEYELHSVTGQAGVNIELDLGIEIGEIRYTDTEVITQEIIFVDDGNGNLIEQTIDVSDGDGGSLSIKDLKIGGENKSRWFDYNNIVSNPSDNLDEVIFEIDIQSDGALVVSGNPTSGNFIDYKITTGAISTLDSSGDEAVRLVDSFSMIGLAAGLLMKVEPDGNKVILSADIAIEDMDIDASTNGLAFEDVTVAGANYIEEVETFGKSKPLSWAFALGLILTPEADSVNIELLPTVMDIVAPKVTVGDGLVGAISIDDLALNNISFKISGHD